MLKRALESIISQTYQDFVVIVSDNCPSAESEQVVQNLNDTRFVYFKQTSNLGLVGNWNFLKNYNSNADYWALLEDDNFWEVNHLQDAINAFETHSEIGMYFSPANDFWDNNGVLTPKRINISNSLGYCVEKPEFDGYKWLFGSRCPSSSVVIKRKIWSQVEDFNPDLPFCHDYLVWASLAIKNPVFFSDKATVNYTYHGANAVDSLVYLRKSSIQMRFVRRKIAFLLFSNVRTTTVDNLVLRILENADDAILSQVIPALAKSPEYPIRTLAKLLYNKKRKSMRMFGHLKATRFFGFQYLKFCDNIDMTIGFFRKMKHSAC